ncbi:hypothetical protein B296_00020188 [Ensete ventricosum]|uniref:Uncharacterized protein n=1 Tax=Ensete ventricosum TaxID=4639 RepID=A0A426XPX4_ENSVE|nr:hypothetical protein B296_00020188 [Ensete ventricosum]
MSIVLLGVAAMTQIGGSSVDVKSRCVDADEMEDGIVEGCDHWVEDSCLDQGLPYRAVRAPETDHKRDEIIEAVASTRGATKGGYGCGRGYYDPRGAIALAREETMVWLWGLEGGGVGVESD